MIIIKKDNIANGLIGETESALICFAIGKYLHISDVELNVIANEKTLDKFSTPGVTIQALLHKNPIPHSYNLILRPGQKNVIDILCHEMVHLGQYESGRLSLDVNTKIFTWEGERYDPSVPYVERLWEIEAFSGQVKIKRLFKKSLKKQDDESISRN